MTEDAPPTAPKIDTSVPHSARIWNYWLGGKDNYPVDREVGDKCGLPAGSYLAWPTASAPGARTARRHSITRRPERCSTISSPERIKGFFAGLTLIDPGVVPVPDSRPDPSPFPPALVGTLGGVGRKAAG